MFKAQLKRRVASSLRAFGKDAKGAVALTFALSTLPIFAAAGVAIDYNRTLDATALLQDLADRAALAAAANKGSSSDQEESGYALITSNTTRIYGLDFEAEVEVDDDSVTVTMVGEVEGTLSSIVASSNSVDGQSSAGGMAVRVKAVASFEDTPGKPVCMLATETTADNAMYFRGNGNIEAENCGFHSDSSSANQALHLQGSATATADFFSTVGGWKQTGGGGSFSIEPESGQSTVGDPLNKSVTCPTATGSSASPSGSAASPTSLSATSYTSITVGNKKVGQFTAGTHYIFGEIDIKNGGVLKGSGVTLVLCGSAAKISMNGGDLQIQAPTTGANSGFAVIGSSTATATNNLTGGSSSHIKGIWYTPKSKMNISGNADFNVNSDYFPIVTKQIEIGGTGDINIGMDYAAYGYAKPEDLWIHEGRTIALIE